MPPRKFAVDPGIGCDPLPGSAGDRPGNPGGHADREHARRDLHPGGHRSPGRDQGARPDDGAIEHGSPVADQCLGVHHAAVHHADMPDRGPLTDLGDRIGSAVQHRAVLDIRAAAHQDRPEVGPEHRPVPDGRLRLDADVAHQGGGGGDPGLWAHSGSDTLEREQWHPPMMHGGAVPLVTALAGAPPRNLAPPGSEEGDARTSRVSSLDSGDRASPRAPDIGGFITRHMTRRARF